MSLADYSRAPSQGHRAYLSQPATPGRDCNACVCPREAHGSWGCGCGCSVSIVHVTRRLGVVR